jgi:hypothetical protein
MSLTRFKDGKTVLTAAFSNKLFGGLYGTSDADSLDGDDPLVSGHVHDGSHDDGHAQKINLTDHVIGELPETFLRRNTSRDDAIPFLDGEDYVIDPHIPDDISFTFGDDTDGFLSFASGTGTMRFRSTDVTGANSANLRFQTGDTTTSGNSGNISLEVGTAAGTRGYIKFDANYAWIQDDQKFYFGTDLDAFAQYFTSGNAMYLYTSDISGSGTLARSSSLFLQTGDRTVTDTGVGGSKISGSIQLFTGDTDSTHAGATAGASGNISIATGDSTSTAGTSGASGQISIGSGDSDDSTTGNVFFTTGNGAGNTGNIYFLTGTTSGGTRGIAYVSARYLNISGSTDGTTSGTMPVIIGTATGDPSLTIAGTMYYNTSDNTLRVYNGSAWKTVTLS